MSRCTGRREVSKCGVVMIVLWRSARPLVVRMDDMIAETGVSDPRELSNDTVLAAALGTARGDATGAVSVRVVCVLSSYLLWTPAYCVHLSVQVRHACRGGVTEDRKKRVKTKHTKIFCFVLF